MSNYYRFTRLRVNADIGAKALEKHRKSCPSLNWNYRDNGTERREQKPKPHNLAEAKGGNP
jgi:hypothetical protein